jgi:hypothetical protein
MSQARHAIAATHGARALSVASGGADGRRIIQCRYADLPVTGRLACRFRLEVQVAHLFTPPL